MTVVFAGQKNLEMNIAQLYALQKVSGASILMPLGTTAITTLLIGYRIYSVSNGNHSSSKRLFSFIVLLVVESAAVYAVILLLVAICVVVPSFTLVQSPVFQVKAYAQMVLIITAVRISSESNPLTVFI